MVPAVLLRYLDAKQVFYRTSTHDLRYTAQETAQAAHVSGKRFAKVVLVRAGDAVPPAYVLAVLPANERVDLARLGAALGAPVELAEEDELALLFPGFEAGAAPPFAELATAPVEVVADRCLADRRWIAFNAGTHADVIEMRWQQFARVAAVRVFDYGEPLPARQPEAPAF